MVPLSQLEVCYVVYVHHNPLIDIMIRYLLTYLLLISIYPLLISAAAGAFAISQINNVEVYEPSPGSMIDETVLITGGSSGLGLETAKRLGAAGSTVILTSRTGKSASVLFYLVNTCSI